ncbi:hypothetical protein FSP39_023997 [Pinctada imbricata]|uniref:Uncharacterized protein n=1 Tax=Pinctada imbricata TaxID=66713 RepID=A0AA88Y887_PINIB|nr:hypothetical protein FSP39_023997 [Pinctada imbricata]
MEREPGISGHQSSIELEAGWSDKPRILPQGQRTDVDYKFEVVGVNVSFDIPGDGMYWVPSGDSPAYGKVYATTERKTELTTSEAYRAIFTEDAFRWMEEQNAYLLLPGIFKENVVVVSGFAYARREKSAVRSINACLSAIAEGQQKTDYIDAYLVRLLSVTTFSLYENVLQGTLQSAISRVTEVFTDYTKRDRHIHRIIPMVNATLEHLQLSSNLNLNLIRSSHPDKEGDRVSILVHQAFEAYVRKLPKAIDLASEAISLGSITFPSGFGISVTSYHKQFELDEPLCFVIRTLETRSSNGKCPRFYVDPLLLAHHMLIQTGTCRVQSALSEMEDITEKLPDHVPYKGKLSYKFTAVYLLHGYKNSSWSKILMFA